LILKFKLTHFYLFCVLLLIDQIKSLRRQIRGVSVARESVLSIEETASDIIDHLYVKWGYFSQAPEKFLARPQTYLASPGIHIKPCINLRAGAKDVLAYGKAVEHWYGFILTATGFRIQNRDRISSKNGEFYRFKASEMSVAKSMEFCEALLNTIASSSAETLAAWIDFERKHSRYIHNFIIYNSWDNIIKEAKRVSPPIGIPTDVKEQFVSSVSRRCIISASARKSGSSDILKYDFDRGEYMGGGQLISTNQFEGRLKFDTAASIKSNKIRILVVGLDNPNVVKAFTSLMTLRVNRDKLYPAFTFIDAKKKIVSAARSVLLADRIVSPESHFTFLNGLLEAYNFSEEKFDVVFSLISGRVTTLFVAAIEALRAGPSSSLLVTREFLNKCRGMNISISPLAPLLFWNVHRPIQVYNRDDSENMVIATKQHFDRKSNKVFDSEASESSDCGNSDDDSSESDTSSNEASALLGDSIGSNYTESVKNIYSFSIERNQPRLQAIVMEDLNSKLWVARTGCRPFMQLLELRDTISIPIYGLQIIIPIAYSFKVSKSGSATRRSITELSNYELNEILAKFVCIAAVVYDFIVQHLPQQFQFYKTKSQYLNVKTTEVFRHFKESCRKFQIAQPATEVQKQTSFYFNRQVEDTSGCGEEEILESGEASDRSGEQSSSNRTFKRMIDGKNKISNGTSVHTSHRSSNYYESSNPRKRGHSSKGLSHEC
jgi:hypothetical protein